MMKSYKIVVLLSYISVASISAVMLSPALPQIKAAYQVNGSMLSWFMGIFLFGYVIGQLIYAPLANAYGRLKAIRLGFILNVIGIIICYLATTDLLHSYIIPLFGRLVTALGASAGLACTFTLINELLRRHKEKVAISYSLLSFMFGIGFAVTLGGVVAQYMHWHDLFIILLIHGVLIYVSTYLFYETLTHKQPLDVRTIVVNYLVAFKNEELRRYALIVGLCSAISYVYVAAAPVIAHNLLKLTPSDYAYWNLLTLSGSCLSGVLAPRLLGRFSGKYIIVCSMILIIICLICIEVLSIYGLTALGFLAYVHCYIYSVAYCSLQQQTMPLAPLVTRRQLLR